MAIIHIKMKNDIIIEQIKQLYENQKNKNCLYK